MADFKIIRAKAEERPIPSNLNKGCLFIPTNVGTFSGYIHKPEVYYSDGVKWYLILEQLLAENIEYLYNIAPLSFTNVEEALNWLIANSGGGGSTSPDVLIDCGTIANPNDNVVIDAGSII
jgi:hypothetical protein